MPGHGGRLAADLGAIAFLPANLPVPSPATTMHRHQWHAAPIPTVAIRRSARRQSVRGARARPPRDPRLRVPSNHHGPPDLPGHSARRQVLVAGRMDAASVDRRVDKPP